MLHLLHHQTHPVIALTPKPTLSFIYNQEKKFITPSIIEKNIYTWFTTPWPYIALSVLTTILVIACLANLWNKFQQSYKTTLYLEITVLADPIVNL